MVARIPDRLAVIADLRLSALIAHTGACCPVTSESRNGQPIGSLS